MHAPDLMRVTYDQNPAMLEAMAQVSLGDKVKFEVIATLKSKSAEGAEFTVEAVVPDGYEVDETGDKVPPTIMGTASDEMPITPTAMLVRRKAAK